MADNCEPRKIDSNKTGLSYADTICGRLPTLEDDGYLPTWYELEPNSYADFGGTVTTTARRPINASRQAKKGTITDLNANGGFNQDYTKSNFTRLLQGVFFADAREKASTSPLNGDIVEITDATSVGGNKYLAFAGGLSVFGVGQLVNVKGFANASNNGVKRITAVADGEITVAEAVTTETAPAGVTIRTVGYQFGLSTVSINMIGALPQLTLSATPVAATGLVAVDALPTDGDTITIGGVVYTFRAAPNAPYETLIGADPDATAAYLSIAINGNILGTPANPFVTAEATADEIALTAIIAGTVGNGITLSTDAADITLSGGALTGGTGFSFLSLGVIVGEWINLDADVATNRFTNNRGYARIGAITDTTMLFDKTTWVPQTESGTGLSVNIWLGTVIKNEKDPDDIITRYYEFERTLGRDTVGTQTEYMLRSVLNELTLNIPLPEGEEAKLNADLTFVSGDAEQRNGTQGRKAGTFVSAPGEDAINTASNILRMRMTLVDAANSRPSALFAYIVEGNLSINNNVTPVKAVANLGSIDVNVGDFDVGGELTAIFRDVAATQAVRNNANVTLDFICATDNAGFVYDIPLCSLGNGIIDVEPGREIRVPLELNGAENPNGYTVLYVTWDYLPTAAMPKAGTAY